MATMKRTIVLLTLASVAACSSSGGADYKSVQAIRDKLDKAGVPCTAYEQNKEVLGAREDGDCKTSGDDQMTITIYDSPDQRDKIRQAFATLHSGIDVQGGAWSVNVATQGEAEQVQKALGGKVR